MVQAVLEFIQAEINKLNAEITSIDDEVYSMIYADHSQYTVKDVVDIVKELCSKSNLKQREITKLTEIVGMLREFNSKRL